MLRQKCGYDNGYDVGNKDNTNGFSLVSFLPVRIPKYPKYTYE